MGGEGKQRTVVAEALEGYLRAEEVRRVNLPHPSEADDQEVLPFSPELHASLALHETLRAIGEIVRGEEVAPPEFVGRYRVLHALGAHSNPAAFLARDPELRRPVVVKWTAADAQGRREGRALARLRHPGVVTILDRRQEQDQAYLVMEYLEGPTLAELLEELRRSKDSQDSAPTRPAVESAIETEVESEVLRLAQQFASLPSRLDLLLDMVDAVAHCHGHRVLHRDLKPHNVVFSKGRPVLVDLGLAYVGDETAENLEETTLVGTLPYLAPEQIASGQTGNSSRSDQYSLAVLAYELLTLRSPFLGPWEDRELSRNELLERIGSGAIVPPRQMEVSLHRDLERVLLQALDVDPERRYASVEDFREDLRRVRNREPVFAGVPSLGDHLRRSLYRQRRRILGSGAFLLGIVLVSGVWLLQRWNQQERIMERALALQAQFPSDPESHRLRTLALHGLRMDQQQFTSGYSGWPLEGPRLREQVEGMVERFLQESRAESEIDWSLRADGKGSHLRWDRSEWGEVFGLQAALFPTLIGNEPHYRMGHVRYPADLSSRAIVFQQVLLDRRLIEGGMADPPMWTRGHVSWWPLQGLPRTPDPGVYRLIDWTEDEAQTRREVEFVAPAPSTSELVLGSGSGDGRFATGLEPVEADWIPLYDPTPGSNDTVVADLFLPGFDIGPLITCGEVVAFLREQGQTDRYVPKETLDPERASEPAFVPIELAEDYALWVGARLPLAVELARAIEIGTVERFDPEQAPVNGEWLGDTFGDWGKETRYWFHYTYFENRPHGMPNQHIQAAVRSMGICWLLEECTEPMGDTNPRRGQGFRLARSRGARADWVRPSEELFRLRK